MKKLIVYTLLSMAYHANAQPTIPFSQNPVTVTKTYGMNAADFCVLYNGNRTDGKIDSIVLPPAAKANKSKAYEFARSYTAGPANGPVAYFIIPAPGSKIDNSTILGSVAPGTIQKLYTDGVNWYSNPPVLIPAANQFFIVNQLNGYSGVQLPAAVSCVQGQVFKIKTYRSVNFSTASNNQIDVIDPFAGKIINGNRGAYAEYILSGNKWLLVSAQVF